VLGGVVFLSAAVALGLRSPGHLSSLWLSNALLLGWMLRSPSYSQRHCWVAAAIALALAEWLSGSALDQTLWLTFVDLAAVACAARAKSVRLLSAPMGLHGSLAR
jgi:hypothetical protein